MTFLLLLLLLRAVIAIRLPRRRQSIARAIDEIPLPQTAKGLISSDPVIGIEIGHDLLEILCAFGVTGAPEPKLANVEFQAAELLRVLGLQVGHAGVDVGFEDLDRGGDVDGGALDVVVDVDGVEAAARAGFDEVLQPRETRGAAAVGDGRRAEGRFARKRLHVRFVGGGGPLRREVRLAGVVGLVGSVRRSKRLGES